MLFVSRVTLLSTLARRLESCFVAHEVAVRTLDPVRLGGLIAARGQASRALVEARRALAELPADRAAAPEPLAAAVAAALELLQADLAALRHERAALAAEVSALQATGVDGGERNIPGLGTSMVRDFSVGTG